MKSFGTGHSFSTLSLDWSAADATNFAESLCADVALILRSRIDRQSSSTIAERRQSSAAIA
jgi:hypothetical protein